MKIYKITIDGPDVTIRRTVTPEQARRITSVLLQIDEEENEAEINESNDESSKP